MLNLNENPAYHKQKKTRKLKKYLKETFISSFYHLRLYQYTCYS